MTKVQEKKLLKEYEDAIREQERVQEVEGESEMDMTEEAMYCEGEINAMTRVLKIMGIKPRF